MKGFYSKAAEVSTGFKPGNLGPVGRKTTVFDPSRDTMEKLLANYDTVGKEDFDRKIVCVGETSGAYGYPVFEYVSVRRVGCVTHIDALGPVERAMERKKKKK
jgi:hypothetical protein